MVGKRELREGCRVRVREALKQGMTHMTNARARQGLTRRRTHGKDRAVTGRPIRIQAANRTEVGNRTRRESFEFTKDGKFQRNLG